MSGLTGIWNLDGEPASAEILAAMSAQLSHLGPDGASTLLRGPTAFACQHMKVTPESLAEAQPAIHPSGALLLWDGRLDNREELISLLHGGQQTWSGATDNALVLDAYARFGSDFVKKLDGDFALVLADLERRQLILARDPMGARTLYYCSLRNTFLFASEIKALLVHPLVEARPDEHSLAEWLFQVPDYADESNTFFQNISRVPPSCMVIVTPGGTKLQRYWDFNPQKTLRLGSYDEYVEAYRDCFGKAVKNRLRSASPVAITVSGGLDSSSIYCMAQHLGTPAAGFFGIGLVGDHPTTNELVYQQAIENKYGIKLEKVPFSTTDAMGMPGKDVWHCEGPFLKWDIWRDLFRRAQARGARVVLSGFYGDQLLQNPQYLLDLFFGFRWVTMSRHLNQYYKWWEGETRKDLTRDLAQHLKGYLIPEVVRPHYHRLRRRFRSHNVERLPWYSDRFVAQATRTEQASILMDIPACRAHAKVLYQHVRSKIASTRMELEIKSDAMMQCVVGYPFRDRHLISLLMAMPGEAVYAEGYRGIHRDAMRGILPDLIRERHTKAAFHEPARLGARNDLEIMRGRLLDGTAQKMGFFCGRAELSEQLQLLESELEEGHTGRATWLTIDIIGLEQWLSTFFARTSLETGHSQFSSGKRPHDFV